jgi:hypothetical protein
MTPSDYRAMPLPLIGADDCANRCGNERDLATGLCDECGKEAREAALDEIDGERCLMCGERLCGNANHINYERRERRAP